MEGQIFQIIQWAVGIIFGGSIVGTFMFFNSKKRVEKANADAAENAAQSGMIDNKSKFYKAQDEIIEDLMKELKSLTTEVIACTKSSKTLESRVSDLEFLAESNHRKIDQLTNERCIVENCHLRNPPRISEQQCKK